MSPYTYYIFDDINIREDSLRVHSAKKRKKIKDIIIRKLVFNDQRLWIFEMDRIFKIYTEAGELEKILLQRGAQLKTYTAHHDFCEDIDKWAFDPHLYLAVEKGQSQNVSYWLIRIAERGNKYYDYGSAYPFKEIKPLKKYYEGNELPKGSDYPGGSAPSKPIPSNLGYVLAFAIIALAALIYVVAVS